MSGNVDLSYAYIDSHPIEAARVLEQLSPHDCAAFLAATPVRLAAPVLRHMLPVYAARCFDVLDDIAVTAFLRDMGVQTGAALLRHIPEVRRVLLVEQLPTSMKLAIRLLLSYSVDTVGAWMDPHVLVLPSGSCAGDALERVRQSVEEYGDTLFVVDNEQRLQGLVALPDVLRADAGESLGRFMRVAPHALSARAPLTSVRSHIGWNTQRVLPVVERGERFVGILNYAMFVSVLSREESSASPPAHAALTELAETYWHGVSGMIDAMIGILPVANHVPSRGNADVDDV